MSAPLSDPILILADLHLDIWADAGRDPLALMNADWWRQFGLVVIAGDLTNKPKVRWPGALGRLTELVEPARLHVMPGNHDYYDHVLDGDDRLAEMAAAAGVGFAQCSTLRHGATRLLCCTMWTDFEGAGAQNRQPAMAEAQRRMNDYRQIRIAGAGYRRARPSDTAAVHARHRTWLAAELARPHDGPTVVVTHHAPHPWFSTHDGLIVAAYASDLIPMLGEKGPRLWAFGHTHFNERHDVGATRFANVSLAYPHEVSDADVIRRLEGAAAELVDATAAQ